VPLLKISLFGGVVIEREHGHGHVRLPRGAETLFAYLVLERYCGHARDELAGLFWGSMPDDRARNCLNTALWRIRRVLEPDPGTRGAYILTTPSGDVRFNTGSEHWLDVAVFEQALDTLLTVPPEELGDEDVRRLDAAVALYTGDVLTGVFSDWALAERERLRARYVDALVYLVRVHRARGELHKALAYGRRVLAVDPIREDAHRELMSVYDELGEPAQAVRQYEQCREILLNELGILPKAETQALRARLAALDESVSAARHPAGDIQLALDLVSRAKSALHDAEQRLDEALYAVTEDGDGSPHAVSVRGADGDRGVSAG
jgi:DNA-binding SARP family transcriptional activator